MALALASPLLLDGRLYVPIELADQITARPPALSAEEIRRSPISS